MSTPTSERVAELAERITVLRAAYYEGEPQVTDAEYDALEDELRGLLVEHPHLTPADNPLAQVGAPAVLHSPVRHDQPMLSLEKATEPEAVRAFAARFSGQVIAVMPKIDGVSLSLRYENGRLVRAATRGDGVTGEDVTTLVLALVDDVPHTLRTASSVEVRGEAVMRRSVFDAYNAAHPDKPLINARSGAAGTLRAKQPEKVAERRLTFLAFDVLSDASRTGMTVTDLAALGFAAVPVTACATADEALHAIAEIELERPALDYDIDGAVLRLLDRRAFEAAGARSNSPRGAIAFKYAAEEQLTKLVDVVWDVGKIGKVAPVGILDPVYVGGTTVTRATLANMAVIEARGIRVADTVVVRRAGDVIPFIASSVPKLRTGDEREVVPPTHCPSCESELVEEGNSRELYCTNLACPAQTVRRLIHWASRAAADIDAIGPVWIERFNEAGLLERPSGFYELERTDLLRFPGMGEVSADRMLESIDRSRRLGLRRALIGLAIPLASEGTAARLCRAGYETLEQVADATIEQLMQVDDIGPKVAASLHEHFNRPATRALIARLRELDVSLDVRDEDRPVAVAADAPFAGKTVVVTGTMVDPRSGERVPRPAMQKLLERAGATIASSVSANTDWLVTGENVGASKLAKASALGVDVVDQANVWQALIGAGIV